MEIYLVRHGETGGNIAHRHQVEKTDLSPLGRKQAEAAAEKLKALQPTHLVTSTLVRAIETSSIIGEVCDLVPITNSSFIEIKRPPYLYGHHHVSLFSLWFYLLWFLGRESEGESYRELVTRIKQAQANLAEYPNDAKVVVVSHSVFINFFIAHACQDKRLSIWQAIKVFKGIKTMPNTQITALNFENMDRPGVCAWTIKI